MHSLKKKKNLSDFAHFTSYVHFKTLIGFALRVSRTKGYSFKSGTFFCGACSQWKELALVMIKCLPFLIIDANSPIDCKLHKRCPRFEWTVADPGGGGGGAQQARAPLKLDQLWFFKSIYWISECLKIRLRFRGGGGGGVFIPNFW